MPGAPIPQRIRPLAWRRPVWVWTPLGLATAVGWPALLLYDDPGPQRLALIAAASVFALALAALGVTWASGRPPKSRWAVVQHVMLAGVFAILTAPFLLGPLLASTGSGFELSLATAPLMLVVGLPVLLVSALLFAVIALSTKRQRKPGTLLDDEVFRQDVQPFR